MTGELIGAAVPVILGGGLITALTALWVARRKTPAEVDNIIVSGAETAVLSIKQALEAEQHAHEQTRADRDRLAEQARIKDLRIADLEARVERFQEALEQMRQEIIQLRTTG